MTNELKDIAKDEPVFKFEVKSLDTAYSAQINHDVRLLSNSNGEPRVFFSDIETSVCADGECKLANIKVYWNLLGNYVGYGIHPELPLTKYEHDTFEREDYAKLHQLLLDENSILKRRKITDLIDKIPVSPSNIDSKDLDGISGATKKEIKESVVKGGLYSCYTLWHIVHGEAKEKIKTYLQSINTPALNTYFLYAPYRDYQIYALKQLNKAEFKEHSKQIASIFQSTDALTRTYVLKKIPEDVLSEQRTTSQFYDVFPHIDINSRTLLIKKLKDANSTAVEIVSKHVGYMTKNQLSMYLKYLEETYESLNGGVKYNLIKASNSKRYAYSYLIKEYLKNR
ncbi:hypothetical protein [Snuella sedimenti]|uniref:Uncharacterized protein n=1 Tax=Snuella sedimenti TaxID=2798802 RepID=A0A8J7J014_9FLAO|nr:hypothetical protein [Snuella sedimenti]MBJ6366997.1 hypothetical protein [Snuella sedimenti]